MYNDHLPEAEAQELIKQRLKEVETYSLQKQLGYGDSRNARWMFVLVVVFAVIIIGLML